MALKNRTSLNVAYGLSNALQHLAPAPINANRAPTSSDTAPIGQIWCWPAQSAAYVLVSNSNATATWNLIEASGAAGVFTSLTVNPGPVTTSGTGAVNISADAAATTVNVGTGGAVKAVTLGSTSTTSATTIQGGSGKTSIVNNSNVAGAVTLSTAGGTSETILISNGDGTAATAVNIVSVAGGITINGDLGITLTGSGAVAVVPAIATVAYPTATATVNQRVIRVIFTGFTTANAGGAQAYTIASSDILTTSGIFVGVTNLNASTNGAYLTVTGIIQAAGSIIINTANNGAGALGTGDDVIVTVWIIS